MWPKFSPWEHVDYKDQIEEYFKTIRKLSYVGLNPKTEIPSCLVTKVDIVEILSLGCESLKTTNLHLHPNTKRELLKFYQQVYGTTIVTNNEFYLWFVKGYIEEQKGEAMNQAKVVVFTTREKA